MIGSSGNKYRFINKNKQSSNSVNISTNTSSNIPKFEYINQLAQDTEKLKSKSNMLTKEERQEWLKYQYEKNQKQPKNQNKSKNTSETKSSTKVIKLSSTPTNSQSQSQTQPQTQSQTQSQSQSQTQSQTQSQPRIASRIKNNSKTDIKYIETETDQYPGMIKCNFSKKLKTPEEVSEDLKGYEMVNNISNVEKNDRIKYIKKDTGEYKKGGYVLNVDENNGYIVVKGFANNYKNCKYFNFSLQFDKIILFKKSD